MSPNNRFQGREIVASDPYDPECDSPEARANFATRHIANLGERRRKRDELRHQYEQEEVTSGVRPNYFTALAPDQVTLMRAKGNVRRIMISEHLKTGGLEAIPPDWRRHDLPSQLKDAMSAEHPQARGGEDLPDLRDGEVEIARLSLVDSVHGEVTSLRAMVDAPTNGLRLRLVDEYETEFSLRQEVVAFPLAPFEVLEFFRDATPSPLDTSCRVSFTSYFYAGLDELAQRMSIGPAGT